LALIFVNKSASAAVALFVSAVICVPKLVNAVVTSSAVPLTKIQVSLSASQRIRALLSFIK
jgi:hypothetical protein